MHFLDKWTLVRDIKGAICNSWTTGISKYSDCDFCHVTHSGFTIYTFAPPGTTATGHPQHPLLVWKGLVALSALAVMKVAQVVGLKLPLMKIHKRKPLVVLFI